MQIKFQPLNAEQIRNFVGWHYEPPYDYYNYPKGEQVIADAIAYYTDPKIRGYALVDESGELIGFCSFGPDGQVGGGDYQLDALDIGMGLRPDRTGQGNGHMYASKVVDYALQEFGAHALRVSIATFNKRAQRVWEKQGFEKMSEFTSTFDGCQFVILVRRSAFLPRNRA